MLRPDAGVRPRPAARRDGGMRAGVLFAGLGLLLVLGVAARLALGSTLVPPEALGALLTGGQTEPIHRMVVLELRWPTAVTAVLAGAALGVAGLQMQTLFANPLADPYVLGVSSGATLGVATVLLLAPTVPVLGTIAGFTGSFSTTVAATLGAALAMGVVLIVGAFVSSSNTLLLLGVMLGSMISAVVTVMLASARPEMVGEFIAWGFGSYRGTTRAALGTLVPVLVVALAASLALAPWLNVLQVGDRYAATMGVPVIGVRVTVIALTAVLAGATTAFCGPIQFLGMAVPHIARQLFRTADMRVLLPGTALAGAGLAVAVDLLSSVPFGEVLPLNAANAAVGAPIVIWVLVRNARRGAAL